MLIRRIRISRTGPRPSPRLVPCRTVSSSPCSYVLYPLPHAQPQLIDMARHSTQPRQAVVVVVVVAVAALVVVLVKEEEEEEVYGGGGWWVMWC